MRWALAAGLICLILTTAVISYFYLANFEPEASSVSEDRPALAAETKAAQASEQASDLGNSSSEYKQTQLDPKRPEPNSSDGWVNIVLILMALATLISSAISFYLYRWRKILLSKPTLVVPEQLGEWVARVDTQLSKLTKAFNFGVEQLSKQSDVSSENVSNMTETFMTLQTKLDERDEEIRRLKRGYDAEIFRKFVSRFIRVDQLVDDFQQSGEASAEDLEHIRRLLGDAFSECDVESFQPEIGSDYRSAHGVADNPKKVETSDPENEFKIVEVLESGYQRKTSDGYDVLVPARVRIQVPKSS